MNLDVGTFAAIGLVSVLGGAANAPLAASIMAVELFGPRIASYAAISCIISFLMTGHRSVYPSQIFAISKAPSIEIEIGKEEEDIHPNFKLKKSGFIGICINAAKKIKSLFIKP